MGQINSGDRPDFDVGLQDLLFPGEHFTYPPPCPCTKRAQRFMKSWQPLSASR